MTKIAILDDYQDVARQMADWGRLPPDAEVEVFHDPVVDEAALVARLADFEVIGIMRERTPFPRRLFAQLPKLRLLITSGSRNAAIDLQAATDHGVTVCGTASPGHATAELAFGLILALARNILPEAAAMRRGGWQTTVGRDLRGATLGIVGLGRLGAQVAALGRAFGMEVVAWSQNLTDQRAADCGARRLDKHALMAAADFVTIHIKLSPRSHHLIDAEALACMKPDAYLVNTSRGQIVDGEALIAALRERRIAGAGLDVYDLEPLPDDHPLRGLDNVVLTPHLGYVTRETYQVFYGEMVEGIAAFLGGAPIRVMTPEG